MARLLIAVLLPLCLNAQSFFNTQGLGEIGRSADARSAALGDHAALGWHNPAWFLDLPRTRITATLLGTGTLGQEPVGSRFVGDARPAGVYAAVPLPLGGRIAFGLDESFNQDFDIWTESLPHNPYRYQVVSRGGIYDLNAGLAWSLFDAVCVGARYSRRIGAAREHWRLETAGGAYVSVDTIETNYSAHALRAGVETELGRFGAGAWFSPRLDYRVETRRRVHGVIGDTLVEQTLSIPATAAAGLRYRLFRPLELSAGAEYRPWSGTAIDDIPDNRWRDAWRVSAGLELALDTLHAVRFGYSHQQGYYALSWAGVEQPVAENRVHLGTGVPIRGFGALDFAIELGRRDNGALTEYAGRLLVSLAYREAWQRRTRRWGY